MKLLNFPDRLFANEPYPVTFSFDEPVAQVFDDMIQRSVPLYHEVQATLLTWAKILREQGGHRFLDIGCSTGTAISLLAQNINLPSQFLGIDPSKPMLLRAREKIAMPPASVCQHKIAFEQGDGLSYPFGQQDFIILNYTLQFLPLNDRSILLKRCWDRLSKNGLLFLSEKIKAEDTFFQEPMQGIYDNFKLRAGYCKSEIERKKAALDNVLIPMTLPSQIKLLKQVGFSEIEVALKWHNFVTILAKK
jgi:tRNA (cmo5U34)-methyltransferase